jgi:SAM-dependent methyltransferase
MPDLHDHHVLHAMEDPRHRGFWPRFGFPHEGPDFSGKSVLEVGSGRGQRCIDIARRGAQRVVGIDPLQSSVDAARERLKEHADLSDVVEYRLGTLDDLGDDTFDAIISEDTLEHVLDVPATLASIRSHLRPGGRAYVGFGPLYHSPIGDHGWMRAALPLGDRFPIPWGHLLAPRKWILRRIEVRENQPAHDTVDWPYLPLNQATVADFRRHFRDSGMKLVYERTNVNRSLLGRAFGLLGRVPGLDKYCTLNMYVIAENQPVRS